MPAKMVARSTLIKVKKADAVASRERAENVRGSEQKKAITAMIAEYPIVQTWPGATVFKYLEPTKQWKPCNKH